jgi:putative GTP pyrophosphokinase
MNETLQEFRLRNRIDDGRWEAAAISWEVLQAIAADLKAQHGLLCESAELFSRLIQKLPGVHSVRWRVKDTEHLLEKIVRKRAEGNQKYANIDESNYHEIVTDLVGLRALHLFKEDALEIGAQLAKIWSPVETPTAYIRKGDSSDTFEEAGLVVKEHREGYRSVHYIVRSKPTERPIFTEIQVRTVFEEAWSEIDHRVRYPHGATTDLINYFLAIFNRLAGSADEMGSFVRGLTRDLEQRELQLVAAQRERDASLEKLDAVAGQLEKATQKDRAQAADVAQLKGEIAKLKASLAASSPLTLSGSALEAVLRASPSHAEDRGALVSMRRSNVGSDHLAQLLSLPRTGGSAMEEALQRYAQLVTTSQSAVERALANYGQLATNSQSAIERALGSLANPRLVPPQAIPSRPASTDMSASSPSLPKQADATPEPPPPKEGA